MPDLPSVTVTRSDAAAPAESYRERLLSVGVIGRRSGPVVREWRDDRRGYRLKATTDELGNTVTEHARGDRQDVHINAPTVAVTAGTNRAR